MNIILRRRKLGKTSCRAISITSELTVIRNDKLHKVKEKPNFLFRWGCTSPCESNHTINKADAITLVNNKYETRKVLANIPNLKKQIIPKTWESIAEWKKDSLFPVIIRPLKHSQGKYLYLANTEKELTDACSKLAMLNKGFYITEYIEKEAEYRYFVAQNRIVWVASKTPGNPKDIAWNVAKGGSFSVLPWSAWPLRGCRIALQAMEACKLDFGGVDIINKGKDYYVLEINSAPSQTSPYRQQCTAKAFKHIIETNNHHYPTPDKINSYKDCIHPAIKVEQ